jgi:hypothetical protein
MLSTLTKVTLKQFNGHTQGYPSSKDKLRFHLVERLETATNAYESNLVFSITTRYPGFR